MSSHERTETHCVGEALDGDVAPAGCAALKSLTLVLSNVITPEMAP